MILGTTSLGIDFEPAHNLSYMNIHIYIQSGGLNAIAPDSSDERTNPVLRFIGTGNDYELPRRLEQKPGPFFRLVDKVLDHGGGADVAVGVTNTVRFAQVGGHSFVFFHQVQ